MGKTSKSRHDTAVQGTNDSSILSKSSSAGRGYARDDYVQYLVAKTVRRSPLINRGYYVRYQAVDIISTYFLSKYSEEHIQIVSVGAGFDSLYFNLKAQGKLDNTTYIEVDFPDVMKRKLALIESRPALSDLITALPQPYNKAVVLQTADYIMLGVDLTQLALLQEVLAGVNVDYNKPTLLISEVAITYMPEKKSTSVIRWAAEVFSNAVFWSYEQILPHDGFGCVMMNHFNKIGSPLLTIDTHPTMTDQMKRHLSAGWEKCHVMDMNHLYQHFLSSAERARISELEPFDEFEEWHLKCAHYMMFTATKGRCHIVTDHFLSKSNADESHSPLDLQNIPNHAKWESNTIHANIFDLETQWGSAMFGLSSNICEDIKQKDSVHQSYFKLHEMQSNVESELKSTSKFNINIQWCKRFGHACCQIGKSVLICGGFGEQGAKHCRFNNLIEFDLVSKECSLQTIQTFENHACPNNSISVSTGNLFERMFHTFTVLSNEELFVYGGRLSPVNVCSTSLILKKADTEENCWNCEVIEHNKQEHPASRWRHTATAIQLRGEEFVVIYGGRGENNSILGDCHLYHTGTKQWREASFLDNSPGPRFSHTATSYNGKLIIAGGLSHEERPLSGICCLDLVSSNCEYLKLHGQLEPRYGHSADIVRDSLLLLGGVALSTDQPGLSVIHLEGGVVQNFKLPSQIPEKPILLHSHQTAHVEDDNHLYVIGGGGNCFSFGTHLNTFYSIHLDMV